MHSPYHPLPVIIHRCHLNTVELPSGVQHRACICQVYYSLMDMATFKETDMLNNILMQTKDKQQHKEQTKPNPKPFSNLTIIQREDGSPDDPFQNIMSRAITIHKLAIKSRIHEFSTAIEQNLRF